MERALQEAQKATEGGGSSSGQIGGGMSEEQVEELERNTVSTSQSFRLICNGWEFFPGAPPEQVGIQGAGEGQGRG